MSSKFPKWKSWFTEVTCKTLIKGSSVARHIWFQAFLRDSCSRKRGEKQQWNFVCFNYDNLSFSGIFAEERVSDLLAKEGIRRLHEVESCMEGPGGDFSPPATLASGQKGHSVHTPASPDVSINKTELLPFLQWSHLVAALPSLPAPIWQRSISWQSGERRGAETAVLLGGVLPSLSFGKKELALLSVSLPLYPCFFLPSQCHSTKREHLHSPPSLPSQQALQMSLRKVKLHHSGGK